MINPKGKLKTRTTYTVEYPQGAFKGASSGEALPAVTASTLSFTTGLPAP
jgi:hypothetical protein